ncbi:MAG: T9SS type A sorting domain-containing protein [Crocinitomicaceae bacterium]|nr:T9SS type A sorting domain-containing protein [Crocinitomicaceae bacterium]
MMTKTIKRVLLTFGAIVSIQSASAQEWKSMMYDPSVNFYEVCDAAEKYFETHDKDVKGSGWKGYMRWRDMNESKFAPSGDRSIIDPYLVSKAYRGFLNDNPTPESLFPNGWNELGPYSIDSITGHYSAGLGRVEDVYVDPSNSDRVYLGSRSGGFWRTLDGGATWSAGLTDNLFATGVNALTAGPTDNSQVLINVQNSGNQYSHGVYRSSDAGDNWTVTDFSATNLGLGGLGSNFRVYELEYHPILNNVVFVGTNQGVYRSDDDLVTWTLYLSGGQIDNVQFHPTDPNIVYAYDTKNGNGDRDYVHISLDAGLTWSLSNQASGNNDAAARIMTTADCTDCLYFASSNGIWKSINNGMDFTFISNPGEGRGAFIVGDTDTTKMIIGSMDTFRSSNSGASFVQSAWWSLGSSQHGSGTNHEKFFQTDKYVHADPRVGKSINGVFYLGTDGFLCRSTDFGVTWEILNSGTSIRENYTLGVSQSNHYTTMIGSQDNGTSFTNESGWLEFYGADGMEAIIHPLNPDYMIGSVQYGVRRRTMNGGVSQNNAAPSGESGSGEADWVAPMAYDPNDQFSVYHFSGEVWKSDDFATTWTELGSPTTFTGDGNVDQAAIAENNSNIIVISRSDKIEKSWDGGMTFTDIKGTLPSTSVKDIAFDPKDDSTIMVVYNQYQDNGNKIFISYDGGAVWNNITFNLNDMPIRSIVMDHSSDSYIYVGGEIGVYVMPKGGTSWTLYNPALPNVTVRELEVCYGSNTLRAATWGRGMWEYSLKDRIDYPAVLTTEITTPPTLLIPLEAVDQFVTSVISYDDNLSSVYLEWSIDLPTFGNAISMTNTQDSTWVSDAPLPEYPEGTKMFFKVFAIGSTGDSTETYKFMYYVRNNPNIGIKEVDKNDFALIFPNPNTGEFTLDLGSAKDAVHVTILTQDGKTVLDQAYSNQSSILFNIDAAAGTYFVYVEADGERMVKKFIVSEK